MDMSLQREKKPSEKARPNILTRMLMHLQATNPKAFMRFMASSLGSAGGGGRQAKVGMQAKAVAKRRRIRDLAKMSRRRNRAC
jgi:hypothetical protein